MLSATTEHGEALPLQVGGHSDTATTSAPTRTTNNKRMRMMMGATVAAAVLLVLMLTDPSKRLRTNRSRSNVDSMVVVSSAATQEGPCLVPPADVAFNPNNSHLSGCRVNPFETCYQYGNRSKFCWSKSYYDADTTGRFCRCVPLPFYFSRGDGDRDDWHPISPENLRPTNTCGPPCTTMKPF